MKKELKYIEQKTGFRKVGGSDNGPAWIGLVKLTESGKGFYFAGKLFRRIRLGAYSNYVASDGNDYWVSGVKKDGDNRYPWGNQKIFLQKSAINEFLQHKNLDQVDSSVYEIVEIADDFEIDET